MNRRKPPLTNRASYKEAPGNRSMHEDVHTGSVIHSARTVSRGTGLTVTVGQPPPHMFQQHTDGPCKRCRSAEVSSDVTARRTLASCNVARYSESGGSGPRDCERCTSAPPPRSCPPVSCNGSGASCSAFKSRRIRGAPTRRASGCIPSRATARASGASASRATGAWCSASRTARPWTRT